MFINGQILRSLLTMFTIGLLAVSCNKSELEQPVGKFDKELSALAKDADAIAAKLSDVEAKIAKYKLQSETVASEYDSAGNDKEKSKKIFAARRLLRLSEELAPAQNEIDTLRAKVELGTKNAKYAGSDVGLASAKRAQTAFDKANGSVENAKRIKGDIEAIDKKLQDKVVARIEAVAKGEAFVLASAKTRGEHDTAVDKVAAFSKEMEEHVKSKSNLEQRKNELTKIQEEIKKANAIDAVKAQTAFLKEKLGSDATLCAAIDGALSLENMTPKNVANVVKNVADAYIADLKNVAEKVAIEANEADNAAGTKDEREAAILARKNFVSAMNAFRTNTKEFFTNAEKLLEEIRACGPNTFNLPWIRETMDKDNVRQARKNLFDSFAKFVDELKVEKKASIESAKAELNSEIEVLLVKDKADNNVEKNRLSNKFVAPESFVQVVQAIVNAKNLSDDLESTELNKQMEKRVAANNKRAVADSAKTRFESSERKLKDLLSEIEAAGESGEKDRLVSALDKFIAMLSDGSTFKARIDAITSEIRKNMFASFFMPSEGLAVVKDALDGIVKDLMSNANNELSKLQLKIEKATTDIVTSNKKLSEVKVALVAAQTAAVASVIPVAELAMFGSLNALLENNTWEDSVREAKIAADYFAEMSKNSTFKSAFNIGNTEHDFLRSVRDVADKVSTLGDITKRSERNFEFPVAMLGLIDGIKQITVEDLNTAIAAKRDHLVKVAAIKAAYEKLGK